MHAPAGQSIAYSDEMTTVVDVIDDLVHEAETTLTRLRS